MMSQATKGEDSDRTGEQRTDVINRRQGRTDYISRGSRGDEAFPFLIRDFVVAIRLHFSALRKDVILEL